ncbi:MAG: hypothetical protein ACI8ZM_004293 [Crocinitomix sp.]|jgi:hypothetical protein
MSPKKSIWLIITITNERLRIEIIREFWVINI